MEKKKEDSDGRRGFSRPRGGLNTKVHAPVDGSGKLAVLQLCPGQDGDGPYGRELLEWFESGQTASVVGDAAYDGGETRVQIRRLQAAACIKPHANRTSRKRVDKIPYRNRNQVRRFFSRIKQFRGVATRYDNSVETCAGVFWLAALVIDEL
ncbi:MAG: transposase [Planctomycetota bacterium]